MFNNLFYSEKSIYGIRIFNHNNINLILYEKKYDNVMSYEMIREAIIFYENLDVNNKNVKFQIYKKCKGIDNEETCMVWFNISLDDLMKKIEIN